MSADTGDLFLNGFGLHSSLGGLASAAAAFRCGLARARELPDWPYFDEDTLHEHKLIGHPAAAIDDGFQGVGRLLKMAQGALGDLWQSFPADKLNAERLAVLFVFPTGDEEQPLSVDLRNDLMSFVGKLWRLSGMGEVPKHTRAIFEGRVGTITALREAKQMLDGGAVDACLLGAIDTLLDPVRLRALSAEDLVKTVDQPAGLMPGEAACFAVLQRSSGAQSPPGRTAGVLSEPIRVSPHRPKEAAAGPGSAPPEPIQEKEPAPATGEALGNAMLQALERGKAGPAQAGTIFSDLNGEEVRAADLGHALVRTRPRYDLRRWKLEIPALSFGDTGAAGTLLAAGLALRAFARGYAPDDTCLLLVSSDTEESGAVVLRRPSHG